MAKQTTIFPKGVISAYVQVAPATPRAGPTLLIVAAMMPIESTTVRPVIAIKNAKKAKIIMYRKKNLAIPAITGFGTVLPLIEISTTIEG